MTRKKYNRIFTIVIDSLGVGAMDDAASYGDVGTDTLGHISQRVEEFRIPNLQKLGLARDEWKAGRVIARPYMGKKKGEFKDAGFDVISVGKIADIFDGEGITESNKSKSPVHGMKIHSAVVPGS